MKTGKNIDLSVVIMAYNEEAGLTDVINEINGVCRGIGRPYEIIVIDDGSTDSTGAAADKAARENAAVRTVHHTPNKGLGEVYLTGFNEAEGAYLTFFSADGQFPAGIISDFLLKMENADLVLGYLPKRDCPFAAKALSFLERVFYTLFFGPMPKFQGIMMIRKSILKNMPLVSRGRGWAIVMELIIRAKRKGFRITSLPTAIRPRINGRSKVVNISTIWSNIRQALELSAKLHSEK